MLAAKDQTQTQLIANWTTFVATSFGLKQSDLANIFTRSDNNNSEMRTRYAWKYAAHKGVSGTPTAFVNGV